MAVSQFLARALGPEHRFASLDGDEWAHVAYGRLLLVGGMVSGAAKVKIAQRVILRSTLAR